MPTLVCDRCGEAQTAGVFETDPVCENCGSTEFHPVEDAL